MPVSLQVRLGLARHVTRIAREVLARHGIDDVGDHAHRRPREERIEARGGRVGHRQHVRLVDALPPADGRAVEAEPVLERPVVPACRSGKEQCCQLPSMSTNFRSTISAPFFLASSKKSFGVISSSCVARAWCGSAENTGFGGARPAIGRSQGGGSSPRSPEFQGGRAFREEFTGRRGFTRRRSSRGTWDPASAGFRRTEDAGFEPREKSG